MQNTAYQVNLENVFEGPMDLLIHLIRKNEVDIRDIPIAMITDQFLSYIEWMQAMNIDFAADFLVMAATLTYIKSRMLLPGLSDGPDESEDPRNEITGPIVEYIRMKAAAALLNKRDWLDRDVFMRSKTRHRVFSPEDMPVSLDVFGLVSAYQGLLDRMAPDIRIEITPEKISVRDRMTQVIDLLAEKGTLTFTDLLFSGAKREDIIVTFLAILELARLNMARIAQGRSNGDIRLYSIQAAA
ncbi:MAG: segregation/condensation protein A [Deltaproteobacteria bacterium]|nr:segregation/condensation protein A [Deltaproteobacteria bacterium]